MLKSSSTSNFAFPAFRWGKLPANRPGALLLPAAFGLIGALRIAYQAWLLRKLDREAPYRTEPYDGSFLPISSWLQAKFGPIAGGIYLVALGSGLSVAFTEASVGSATWQAFPWATTTTRQALLDVVGAIVGALIVALSSGLVLRSFDRGQVFAGGRRRLQRDLSRDL
jgi:hypothetical protein